MKKLIALSGLVVACGSPSGGFGVGTAVSTTVSTDDGASNPLAIIRADELRRHVEVLASDEYGGRGTLQDGEQKAAGYLSGQFSSFGLVPLPGRKDYRLPAKLQRRGYDSTKTRVVLTVGDSRHVLVAGRDFTPFSFSSDGAVSAPVVFAGYGISAPKLGYDDYKGLDVKGKIVFVLRHAPNGDQKDNNFKGTNHASFRTKAAAAQKRGALGMILVTDPAHRDKRCDDFSIDGRLRMPPDDTVLDTGSFMTLVRVGARIARASLRGKGDTDFFAVHVTPGASTQLVAGSGMTVRQLQEGLNGGQLAAKNVRLEATAKIDVHSAQVAKTVHATNVVGYLPGQDPKLRNQWIVVGGHYDHLGHCQSDGDGIFNGADDNASGTSGVLAVARAMAALGPQRRSLVFVGFSGEEKGLLGSKAIIRQKQLAGDVVFMINMDMIGRNPDRPVTVSGDGFATGLKAIVEAANNRVGLDIKLGGNYVSGNSDHAPFFNAHVPILNFFTGLHDDYHQLADHADKLHYDRMAKVANLVAAITRGLANAETTPDYIHRPFWFGAAMKIAKGLVVVLEVEPKSPADKAGLRAGDEIFAIGQTGMAVSGVGGLDEEVSRGFDGVKPGSSNRLTFVRDGKHHSVDVARAKTGYLGVFPRGVDSDTRKKYGLGDGQGVLIAGLSKDGPAGKAGIKKGDILVEIAGQSVGAADLGRRLSRIGAGEKVLILLVRGGKRLTLPLVLGERPTR